MKILIAVLVLLGACTERSEQPHLETRDTTPAIDSDWQTDTTAATADPPSGAADLESVLNEVLRGPGAAERAAGAQSWFSDETADVLKSASVDASGHAVVDFEDLRAIIPNASSSAGSDMLLRELNAAVFSIPEIRSVEYRINGSCAVFGDWLQYGCRTIQRP